MEILKTDVLVIGGGGAGMRAALTAREEGAEVALVSKTPIGKSTCTQLSGGAFSVTFRGIFPERTHYEFSLLTGRGLNQKEFLQALVDEAPQRIRELERFRAPRRMADRPLCHPREGPVWGNAHCGGSEENRAETGGFRFTPGS